MGGLLLRLHLPKMGASECSTCQPFKAVGSEKMAACRRLDRLHSHGDVSCLYCVGCQHPLAPISSNRYRGTSEGLHHCLVLDGVHLLQYFSCMGSAKCQWCLLHWRPHRHGPVEDLEAAFPSEHAGGIEEDRCQCRDAHPSSCSQRGLAYKHLSLAFYG